MSKVLLALFSAVLSFTLVVSAEAKNGARPAAPTAKTNVCKKDRTLNCLKTNFKALYQQDFNLFFAILKSSRDQATRCKGPQTAAYFDVAPFIQGNSDVTKYFYTSIEKQFVVNRPECFLRTFKAAHPATKKEILKALNPPHYISRAQMKDSLSKFNAKPDLKPVVGEVLSQK